MRQHAVLGAALAGSALDREQARWVRHHHERWDGAGALLRDALRWWEAA